MMIVKLVLALVLVVVLCALAELLEPHADPDHPPHAEPAAARVAGRQATTARGGPSETDQLRALGIVSDVLTYIAGVQRAQAARATIPAVEVQGETADHAAATAPSTAGSSWDWDALAECERPGDGWNDNHGPVYEGKLGFAASTWDGWRDDSMPDNAGDATREQQIQVAERVAADVGISAWGCARTLGWTR